MHLLIVGSLSGLGGAERSLLPLARELTNKGYKLTLLLLRSPNDASILSNFSGQVMVAAAGRGRRLLQLSRAIAQADCVIVTSELTPTYVTWLLSRWHGKPLIAEVQAHLSQWIQGNCH